MFFANDQRETVREENPGISFGKIFPASTVRRITRVNISAGQVGKVLGDKWKALNEKGREPYEKKAATDKKRYEDEKAKYNVSAIADCEFECALTIYQAQDEDEDED